MVTPSSRTWSHAVTVSSVFTQLQSWTQALELGQAVSQPSPKELGLVHVESQSVVGHPSTDIDNAVCQLIGSRGGVLVVTVQVQLRVIREGMEGNTVSVHNVHKVGHIDYKQQRAQYGLLYDSLVPCGTEQTM